MGTKFDSSKSNVYATLEEEGNISMVFASVKNEMNFTEEDIEVLHKVVIPPCYLLQIVHSLVETGYAYQENNNIDIGFPKSFTKTFNGGDVYDGE